MEFLLDAIMQNQYEIELATSKHEFEKSYTNQ